MSMRPGFVNFEEKWGPIRNTILAMLDISPVPRTVWREQILDVYSLCVANPRSLAPDLYYAMRQLLLEHIHSEMKRFQETTGAFGQVKLYYDMWCGYYRTVNYLNLLFLHVNQHHIRKHEPTEGELIYGYKYRDIPEDMIEVREMAIQLWKEIFMEKIVKTLMQKVMFVINMERRGHRVAPAQPINGVMQIFVSVDNMKYTDPKFDYGGRRKRRIPTFKFYTQEYEEPYLLSVGNLYKQASNAWMQAYSLSEYMKVALRKITEENDRGSRYLYLRSHALLAKLMRDRLVCDHLEYLNSECQSMIESLRIVDLMNLHQLLRPVEGGLNVLIEIIGSHIEKEAMNKTIVPSKPNLLPIEFVENVAAVYKKYKHVMNMAFKNNKTFHALLDNACIKLMKAYQQPSAELLAKYCDVLLKTMSAKTYTEAEVDDKLSDAMIVFKYLEDVDVFETMYQRDLAKRRMLETSLSEDAEEGMISRLKTVCCRGFITKLQTMFTDTSASTLTEQKAAFHLYLDSQSIALNVNFHITVLKAGAWPMALVTSPFLIPQEVEQCFPAFEAFYGQRFSGRKLTWLHHNSTCEVQVGYTNTPYLITMQAFHFGILTWFETTNELSYKDLQEATSLNDVQLTKHIDGLVHNRILRCDDPQINEHSIIRLNTKYNSKRLKLKISAAPVQKRVSQPRDEESNRINAIVGDQRKFFIRAAIVRIMKVRKVLKHNDLFEQLVVAAKGRFSPQMGDMKSNLEILFDQGYVARNPDNSDEYTYVA